MNAQTSFTTIIHNVDVFLGKNDHLTAMYNLGRAQGMVSTLLVLGKITNLEDEVFQQVIRDKNLEIRNRSDPL